MPERIENRMVIDSEWENMERHVIEQEKREFGIIDTPYSRKRRCYFQAEMEGNHGFEKEHRKIPR